MSNKEKKLKNEEELEMSQKEKILDDELEMSKKDTKHDLDEELKISRKDIQHKLEEELEELQDKYLRTLAELENTRKRMQKEKFDALSFAIENIIAEFLPLIDNFENALNFANETSEEVKNWALGFQMILSQLKDILHNHGIVAYHSIGNIFDPHYHEAMEIIQTDDHPEGSIIEVFAKGYKSINRIIRPAKVKITQKISEKSINQPSKEEENKTSHQMNKSQEVNTSDGEDTKI